LFSALGNKRLSGISIDAKVNLPIAKKLQEKYKYITNNIALTPKLWKKDLETNITENKSQILFS